MTSVKASDDSPVTENENNFTQENESQWENGQLGRNWFSPPITSTQISFDWISLDGRPCDDSRTSIFPFVSV